MKIKLYNTLTKKIEEFKPIKKGRVGMYTCGMTVYDHTHLGHMRTYVNTDVLRRMLEYNGLKVKQVENVTDVGHLFGDRDMGEDKLEKTAEKAKLSAWEIARKYEKEFFETMDALNVKRPTVVCRATAHIKEMIELVKRLEKNGFTYQTSDGIYFDTSKIKDYNKLSGMPLAKLKEGARIEVNPEKKNPTDFVLWKFTPKGKNRQMEWPSPWAKKSFPGWHIECSAMGMKYLGEKIDIHTGGEDHINVHHTNERAQNIGATGHPVVNLWFHNIFLVIEGKKMSKSLKNFFWLKDVEERGIEPLALRYLFLTAHYRSRMNFTWKSLKGAEKALNKLRARVSELKRKKEFIGLSVQAQGYDNMFKFAINDDLQMPGALADLWRLLEDKVITDGEKYELITNWDKVFGLDLNRPPNIFNIPKKIEKLVKRREELRKKEKWQKADEVRKKIKKLGWLVEDTDQGPKLKSV
jgi:cysteinyl-tRNA synthetase